MPCDKSFPLTTLDSCLCSDLFFCCYTLPVSCDLTLLDLRLLSIQFLSVESTLKAVHISIQCLLREHGDYNYIGPHVLT